MEQEKVVAIGTSDMMQVQNAFNHRKTHVKKRNSISDCKLLQSNQCANENSVTSKFLIVFVDYISVFDCNPIRCDRSQCHAMINLHYRIKSNVISNNYL